MKTAPAEHNPMPKTNHRNLYQEVTDKIISLIERGVAPWRRTWNTYGLARNYVTGHIYTGINMILLNNTGHPIPYFMTYTQIQERGGYIRKGAKAEMVIYFNVYFKDEAEKTVSKEVVRSRKEAGDDIQVLKFIRYFQVYNVADIGRIEVDLKHTPLEPNEKNAMCEAIVNNMPNRPQMVMVNSSRAFYHPQFDYINMPAIEQFASTEAYCATLFHELTHATGHASRLRREAVMNPQKFGSIPYGQEELLAEMGASFLCSSIQIDFDAITENSAAYLKGWLDILKADNKFIFKAAAEAQKAVDYILNRGAASGE